MCMVDEWVSPWDGPVQSRLKLHTNQI
jgi:hypothetical protein